MTSAGGRAGLLAVFVALCLTLFSWPGEAALCQQTLPSLAGEWLDHRQDEFIFQYSPTGEHALQSLSDTQASGVPDVLADAAVQLVVMREMLKHLGFQLPLRSQRYAEQGASHILVRFRKLEGLNGRAFDEVRRLPSGECVLIIEVTSDYRSGNLTPAHELFHQVQNGYTPFKRPWFYEGTARWSETILGKTSIAARTPPANEADQATFLAQSYAAVSIWYGLIERCDGNPSELTIPQHLRDLRYRNGLPVIVDADIPGHAHIRKVLQALNKLGGRVSRQEGVHPHHWPENLQRDSRFDSAMWSAVLHAGGCDSPVLQSGVSP